MTFRYLSVCSGIEAASVAWGPLGWICVGVSEIAPFPAAVLRHHYPDVPNLGDMTAPDFTERAAGLCPDVLVAGTPCQSFSGAGLRGSLADSRGILSLEFVRIANAVDDFRRSRGLRGSVVLWENVPGVLRTRDNAFGHILAAMVGADAALVPGRGQKWSRAGLVAGPRRRATWRVLDAQYFGLAQRRERVFVIASADPEFDPSEVLFEPEGRRRHSPPRRETGAAAAALTANSAGAGGPDDNQAAAGHLIAAYGGNNTGGAIDVSTALNACKTASGRQDFETETFVVHGTQDPDIQVNLAHALGRNQGQENVVCVTGEIAHTLRGEGFDASEDGTGRGCPITPTLDGVRRLLPVECERLQGFPDNYTQIPWRGKSAEHCPDGPRYQAIGNSMAVPAIRWLGERIAGEMKRIAEAAE